jgi:hypothetical protein
MGLSRMKMSSVLPGGGVMRFNMWFIAALALLVASVGLTAAGDLQVPHDGLGTAVEKRVLKGEAESFPAGTTVFYWTRVLGGKPGDRIRHRWTFDGKSISIGLAIGGSHWRTYSSKRLDPDQLGEWTVEALDAEDKVLASKKFLCTAE